MDRRGFLAFIPTISAIPLIGQEIINTPEKVTIIKPEPLRVHPTERLPFDLQELEFRVFDRRNGKEVSTGIIESMEINAPFVHPYQVGNLRQITIQGRLFTLDL